MKGRKVPHVEGLVAVHALHGRAELPLALRGVLPLVRLAARHLRQNRPELGVIHSLDSGSLTPQACDTRLIPQLSGQMPLHCSTA